MSTPDDLTPDAFARLSALEQSQELLRRAQFLNDASRRWHAETLDWHQAQLDDHARRMARYDQLHEEHVARMARMDRQYDKLLEVQLVMAGGQVEHEAKMEMMRVTLDAIKDLLRDRRN